MYAFSLINIIFCKRVHETQKWMRQIAFHLCLPSKMRHNADGCKINASSCVQNAFIGYMGSKNDEREKTINDLLSFEQIYERPFTSKRIECSIVDLHPRWRFSETDLFSLIDETFPIRHQLINYPKSHRKFFSDKEIIDLFNLDALQKCYSEILIVEKNFSPETFDGLSLKYFHWTNKSRIKTVFFFDWLTKREAASEKSSSNKMNFKFFGNIEEERTGMKSAYSPLFQWHQGQLCIEWKLLRQHFTDFKKREKLHLCNKNLKNDFSLPNVFLFSIATSPLISW